MEIVSFPVEGSLAARNSLVVGLVVAGAWGDLLSHQNEMHPENYVEVVWAKREWAIVVGQGYRLAAGATNSAERTPGRGLDIDPSQSNNRCCR